MRSTSGRWGFLALILAVLVGLLLAARVVKTLGPSAVEISQTDEALATLDDAPAASGESAAGQRSRRLEQLQRGADAHAADVQSALDTTQ